MNEGYRYDDAEIAGEVPTLDSQRAMAQILSQELVRRREHALLDYMETCFSETEDAIPIGDLLDRVKAKHGDEKMATAMTLIYTMQKRGEAVLYEDNDRQRIVVQRLYPAPQA